MSVLKQNFSDISVYRGVSTIGNRERYEMHTHQSAEILCFLSGKGIYHIEGSTYELTPGDILLMRPSESHFIEVDFMYDYDRIVLNFDPGLLSSIDADGALMRAFYEREPGKRNCYKSTDFSSEKYREFLNNMIDPPADRFTIIGNLIFLLREINKVFDRNDWVKEPDTIENKIIAYINSNLEEDLSIKKLCNTFLMCRAKLCQILKNATGTSVGNYIKTKRLLKAQELIFDGNKPTKVCEMCGYHDYSTFYRAYNKFFGYSPKEKNSEFVKMGAIESYDAL